MKGLQPPHQSWKRTFMGGVAIPGHKQLQNTNPAGFVPLPGTQHLLVGMDRGGGPFAHIIGQIVTAIRGRGFGRILVEAEDGTRFMVESKYLKRPKVK